MAYTQAQLTALQSAISTGRLKVEYPNGAVVYRDLDEMERIERKMQREITGAPGTPNTIGIRSGKGL